MLLEELIITRQFRIFYSSYYSFALASKAYEIHCICSVLPICFCFPIVSVHGLLVGWKKVVSPRALFENIKLSFSVKKHTTYKEKYCH